MKSGTTWTLKAKMCTLTENTHKDCERAEAPEGVFKTQQLATTPSQTKKKQHADHEGKI